MLKHRNSLQNSLCPYLCCSEIRRCESAPVRPPPAGPAAGAAEPAPGSTSGNYITSYYSILCYITCIGRVWYSMLYYSRENTGTPPFRADPKRSLVKGFTDEASLRLARQKRSLLFRAARGKYTNCQTTLYI